MDSWPLHPEEVMVFGGDILSIIFHTLSLKILYPLIQKNLTIKHSFKQNIHSLQRYWSVGITLSEIDWFFFVTLLADLGNSAWSHSYVQKRLCFPVCHHRDPWLTYCHGPLIPLAPRIQQWYGVPVGSLKFNEQRKLPEEWKIPLSQGCSYQQKPDGALLWLHYLSEIAFLPPPPLSGKLKNWPPLCRP